MDQEDNEPREHELDLTFSSSDSLFCSDETYEGDKDDESRTHYSCCSDNNNSSSCNVTETLFSGFAEQDLSGEEDELSTLLSKEADQEINTRVFGKITEPDPAVSGARREAVEWIVQANAHHCFSALTALLAVDYLDRFMIRFDGFRQRELKPWMTELAAVACLSLAAKVEEINVPLLLDLQVEGTSKFMFEAKMIQRMEILVLSTLQWRMNPLTSLSFLHHISKRFGLKERISFEFLARCELILLSIVSDYRFTLHLPSAIAAATALHVVNSVATTSVASECEKHLLRILKIDKDKVERCRHLVRESVSPRPSHGRSRSNKRKLERVSAPGSPNGVMDASFSSDGSTDSWPEMTSPTSSLCLISSDSSSVTSSPEPCSKKIKNTAKNTTRRR